MEKKEKGTMCPSPQVVEFERNILGAMMLEHSAIADLIDMLWVECFYDARNQVIYQAIRDLYAQSKPVDLLTVADQLRTNKTLKTVGEPYLSGLVIKVTTTGDLEVYAAKIVEKYLLRELIKASSEATKNALDDSQDVFEVLNQAEQNLFKIAENILSKSAESLQTALPKVIAEIETATQNKDGISGVPTGFHQLDKLTAGWQKSDMIVLAARPGMGKTALVLSMARNIIADYKIPVAFFSLEMSTSQLLKRLIASETKIDSERIRNGQLSMLEMEQIHQHSSRLLNAPLYIDDTPSLCIFDLRAKARRLKKKHDIRLLIVDYLQLMSLGTSKNGMNREQEISTISRSIKALAKELNIPIIALSQLNRSVEARGGDKKPLLSDLRESGAIEQDADIVAFIHRAEYYGQTTDENGESLLGIGEFIIAKHRNGRLASLKLQFEAKYAQFRDASPLYMSEKKQTVNTKNSQNNINQTKKDSGQIPF